ncbi:MAG: protein kinase, partial [Gemmatimonadaceae bacterium]|nr:protein kinase [Gemmatimonadaceae bacterium]
PTRSHLSSLTDRLRAALAGRYDIEREQGRGGMAIVFRARDLRHDRTVAVKVLLPELGEALGAERFLREVRITAKLSHPHILPLLDSGEADGLLFYVMPFVEGESLRDRLAREGELPVDDALRITREVADALGYAHAHGVVHRDIKPENILLQGGHALVADFGIARAFDAPDLQPSITMTGTSIGTPLYMSPEQAHGDANLDGRSDLYSLGCVAYEMLTSEPPYTGPNAMAITARKLTEPVPPLRSRRISVSTGLESAITRVLARTPADRFRTAHEFLEQISEKAITGETIAPTRSLPAVASGRSRAVLAGVAVLVLAAVGWFAFRPRAGAATAGGISSVAILPFENLSPDTAQAYFALGLADEIITSLSMVEGMKVASRTSTTVLAGQGLEIAELGRRLGVATVVEGSVRAAGERMRVTARLVPVDGGAPLWSETFERTADDALRIQEEIAGSIVEALKGKLGGGQLQAVSSGTTDPDAYDLYLQGRSLRQRQTEQTIARSAEFFQQAIARAPDFARAHASLAEVRAVQGYYEYTEPGVAFPAAARAAEEALRLDSRIGSAHATRAYVSLYYAWDLAKSEREFKQALAVEPNSAIAHQWYANLLVAQGRFEQAEQEFRIALAIDPAAPVRRAALIYVDHYSGNYPRGVATYRSAVAIDSSYALTFLWGSWVLEGAGLKDEAIAALTRSVDLSSGGIGFVAALARMRAVRGETAVARRLLAQVTASKVVPAYDVALIHLALGDRAEALRWLERAYQARSHSMVLMRHDPHLDPLRGDPAFEAIAKKVGI